MKITLEQIDLLRKRANVSYTEAKETLEKFDGDMVEALAYLDSQKKLRGGKECFRNSEFVNQGKSILDKGNSIRFIISRKERNIINIPLTIALIGAFFFLPFFAGLVILSLIAGCKIRFEKESGEGIGCINNQLEKVSNAVNNVTENIK